MLFLDNRIAVRISTDFQFAYNSLSPNCFTVYFGFMLPFVYAQKNFKKKLKKKRPTFTLDASYIGFN